MRKTIAILLMAMLIGCKGPDYSRHETAPPAVHGFNAFLGAMIGLIIHLAGGSAGHGRYDEPP